MRDFALPGTQVRYARDRVCDIQHIKLALDIDMAGRAIRGTCSLTLAAISGPLDWLSLDAVELDIARISSSGHELPFSYDGQTLRIDLQSCRRQGNDQVATVDIEYSARPRRGLYFIGPDQAYPHKPVQMWSQGQDEDSRFWFPCFDSPHEKATSEVIATVPSGMFALSNGDLVSDTITGERRTLHWRFNTPHSCYLITLVVGELSEIRERWRDVDVTYYVTPGREEDARRSLGCTPEMLELFSRLFGVAYPYTKYAQVFVGDFIFGGMENTTATTLADTYLIDERARIDYDIDSLVAHELAHQWFGDLITCRDWGEGWLNEGFATYAEYIWYEHKKGRDQADLERKDWAERYFSEDAERYRRKIATKVYDQPIDIFDHHLYEKAGCVLHMLRSMLGDELFYRSIAHYLQRHRDGSVETRDFARAIEAATGRVLDWFFAQWVTDGAGHPELTVSYAWDPERQLMRVTVKQTQRVSADTPLFRLPTTVRFRVHDRDRDFAIEVSEPEQSFFFALASEPSQAILDPGKNLLARIKSDKGIHLLQAELAHATLAMDRMDAAGELARRGGVRAAEALMRGLTGDASFGVRAACARGLGELRSEQARDAICTALASEQDPRVRRAMVRALGEFRHDQRAQEVLAGVVENGDASYFVEAEACTALGKTRSPRAEALLAAAAGRDSWNDIIRQHAHLGLAEARADSALPLLRQGIAYGRPSQGRRAAVKALATLVQGRRDRESRDIRDLAEQLLDDKDFRVQLAAIEALEKIGDPAVVPALEAVASRDLDGRLRRRSREVIRNIREGSQAGEHLQSLRDEVERLRAESLKLRDRLEAVETLAALATKKKRKKKKN